MLTKVKLQNKRQSKKLKRKAKAKQKRMMLGVISMATAYQRKYGHQLNVTNQLLSEIDRLKKKNNALIKENVKLEKRK